MDENKPEWVKNYEQALSMRDIPEAIMEHLLRQPSTADNLEARLNLMSISSALFHMRKWTIKMSHFTDYYN